MTEAMDDQNMVGSGLKQNIRQLAVLTKQGIAIFTLICAVLGYAIGYTLEDQFSFQHFFLFALGFHLLCSGSFAINQAQEHESDRQMKRTQSRPVVTGWISAKDAVWLGAFLLSSGLAILWMVNEAAAWLGLISAMLYNGFYTMIWKRRWAFAAVPGALPGAMPVVIGYAAIRGHVFSHECLYLFLIMFLWQMPHFWAIAIKCKDDYASGNVPVLPNVIGVERTVFHIGLYTFVYVALAVASPWFVPTRWLYIFLVVPVAMKMLYEFIKYYRSADRPWLSFFLWTNISLLVFLVAPVVDKWIFIWSSIASN